MGEILGGIQRGLGYALGGIYSVVHNYGLAILLLTIVVRALMIPLTFKQIRSMTEMQRIQPEIKKIQAKFKGDRQKMNEEVMKLYKEHGVNPMGGCLPLVMQMPVFIAMFSIMRAAIIVVPLTVSPVAGTIPLDAKTLSSSDARSIVCRPSTPGGTDAPLATPDGPSPTELKCTGADGKESRYTIGAFQVAHSGAASVDRRDIAACSAYLRTNDALGFRCTSTASAGGEAKTIIPLGVSPVASTTSSPIDVKTLRPGDFESISCHLSAVQPSTENSQGDLTCPGLVGKTESRYTIGGFQLAQQVTTGYIASCNPALNTNGTPDKADDTLGFTCKSALGTGHLPAKGKLFRDITADKAKFLTMHLGCTATQAASSQRIRECTTAAEKGGGATSAPYYILIAFIVASGYFQSRQMAKRATGSAAQQQKTMMKIMPVFFGFISLNIPAGANVYFLATNVWTIGQQGFVLKKQDAEALASGKAPPVEVDVPKKPGGLLGLFGRVGGGPQGNASGSSNGKAQGKPAGPKALKGQKPAGPSSAKGAKPQGNKNKKKKGKR